ncbi:MAG: SDR family oxidoreductase [Bacteroidota bacterium]
MTKKILITGSNGLLGQKLAFIFSQSDYYDLLLTSKQPDSVFGKDSPPYKSLDVTNRKDTSSVIKEFAPHIIVNASAMTDVDGCELHKEQAWQSNVVAVENIVSAAKKGTHILHYSTDYIFDGTDGPYDEIAIPNPISYYGRTKLASENVLWGSGHNFTIIRTMVLYGVGKNIKSNFALWLVKMLRDERPIRIVDDQTGNPTYADDLAYASLKAIELEKNGLYNIAGAEIVSRYDFAIALAKIFHFSTKLVTAIKTSELQQRAPRPLRSGLITLKAETQLGISNCNVLRGIEHFKHQLELFEQSQIINIR